MITFRRILGLALVVLGIAAAPAQAVSFGAALSRALAPGVPLAWPRLPNAFFADVVPALNDLSASLHLAYTRLRSL